MYLYRPLTIGALVLRCAHEQVEKWNQTPSIAREQFVAKTLFDFLDILDKPNQLIVFVASGTLPSPTLKKRY